MAVHLDAIGNVCGRYEGDRPGLPCLMLGSHYDTVRDAGKWDGPLGLITAIACVADLNRRGVRLPLRSKSLALPTRRACGLPPRCSAAGR
jgi:allantoate deiminase